MNLTIQTPKAATLLPIPAATRAIRPSIGSTSSAQRSVDTFERGCQSRWQSLISDANSSTNRSANLDVPGLDTPELQTSASAIGRAFRGMAGMGEADVDALNPNTMGNDVSSGAVDAVEEDGENKMQNALNRSSHYNTDCSAAGGAKAALKGAGLGLLGAGLANAAPPIAGTAALSGGILGFADWHFECATDDNANEKKIADLEQRLEALEKENEKTDSSSGEAGSKGDTCQDPTDEPMPTEEEAAEALEKVQSGKPSCPESPDDASQRSVIDLERMYQTRQDTMINWGPDGQTPTSDDDVELPTKETPCGPGLPNPDQGSRGSNQE